MKTLNATLAALLFALIFLQPLSAAASEPAILVIGASFSEAKVPFDDNMVAPLGGISVALGSYLSLGNALVKDPRLPGYVINEAQAGATSFDRSSCNPGPACVGEWQGYEKQLQMALARVTIPVSPPIRNARYVVITLGNDCLHSDAFGIPQDQTTPCDYAQMNAYIDRLLAVGQQALDASIIPVYDVYPPYSTLDMPSFQAAAGLYWVASEANYNALRDLHRTRLQAELPGAVVLDVWADFEHMGDGLHPSDKTTRKAATMIAQFILDHP
ncbi:SGNH/GDSL hydrolase family protein [Pseudomonadota bacterium]